MFERVMVAGWGDMDFNSHMRNTAYLDRSADLRMMFFSDSGFPMSEFVSRRIGPVVRKDTIEYFSEINLLEEFKVTLSMAGLSVNGSQFLFRNEFYRSNNKLAATVTSNGGWLDLEKRRLSIPPAGLLSALSNLQKTDDFVVLNPSVREG